MRLISATATVGLLLTFCALATTAACGQFLAANSAEQDPAVDAGALTDAADQDSADAFGRAESGASTDGAADAAPLCPVSTQLVTEPIVASASAFLGDSAQHFDAFPICNMSSGNCLMRFSPSSDAFDAFANQRVLDVTLTIYRASESSQCGGSCQSLREDGTLTVNAARSDWDPSTVTYNNRTAEDVWQTPGVNGPSDIGDPAATSVVAAADDAASATLSPAAFAAFLGGSNGSTISVRSTFMKAGSRRQFVVVLIPRVDTQPNEPPKLTIRYCH